MQIIDNTDSICNDGLFFKKSQIKQTIILSFYVSVTQQQYVATRQYT